VAWVVDVVSELEQRAIGAEREAREFQHERDQLQSDIDAEYAWRRKFRLAHGAKEDESMIDFLERLARERDAAANPSVEVIGPRVVELRGYRQFEGDVSRLADGVYRCVTSAGPVEYSKEVLYCQTHPNVIAEDKRSDRDLNKAYERVQVAVDAANELRSILRKIVSLRELSSELHDYIRESVLPRVDELDLHSTEDIPW
jgi:hypothetical protein